MANHLPRILVSLLLGAASFGLARYLQVEVRLSILLGAVVSGVTFVPAALDFVKKAQEIWKLKLENEKLGREAKEAKKLERDKSRMVQLATPEETSKFGVSVLERKLVIYREVEEEKERLEAKNFIYASSWKKIK